MSYLENRRIELNSLSAVQAGDCAETEAVLYAVPLSLSRTEEELVRNKYAEMFFTDLSGKENLMSYQSNKESEYQFVPGFTSWQKVVEFGRFFKKISKTIKSYSTLHLFTFSSVSFQFQIIPLLILGKFFRKQVVIELLDFKNYYLPEESGMVNRYFFKFADSVIVPSDRQSRSLRQKKIKAVTMKAQVDIIDMKTRVIEEVQPLILASAYLENVFNVNCLLKAFKLVKQKYPRAELVIAGSGSQKETIERMISSKSISGVSLMSSEESKEFFNKADVFVHCYHIEYFAQEILQAMAHGIPVLASPLGMVNNLIQKENILMYQFNDFSTLADNFLLLIENNSVTKKLSENGVKFAHELLKTNSKNRTVSFYKNLS